MLKPRFCCYARKSINKLLRFSTGRQCLARTSNSYQNEIFFNIRDMVKLSFFISQGTSKGIEPPAPHPARTLGTQLGLPRLGQVGLGNLRSKNYKAIQRTFFSVLLADCATTFFPKPKVVLTSAFHFFYSMRLCHCQMTLLVPDISLLRYMIIKK